MSYATSKDLTNHTIPYSGSNNSLESYMRPPPPPPPQANVVFQYPPQNKIVKETFKHTNEVQPGKKVKFEEKNDKPVEEKHISINIKDTPNNWKGYNPGVAPDTWGSAFWFTLHNGANNYPIDPTPTWKQRMKNFILGIPVMIPCESCEAHASSYIQVRFNDLDDIVSNREKLFTFFVEFHNEVNKRVGKNTMSLQEAKKIYV